MTGFYQTARSVGTTRGARGCACRVAVTAGLLLAIGWAPSRAAADQQITVQEEHGTYTVAARFPVSASAATAFAVLTDYEQIPRFMPDVRTSNVLERSDSGAVIEQEAVAQFMVFSKRLHLVLAVREGSGTISFRDRCGKSFARYEGAWTISEQDGGVSIAYELTAKPSFDVPEFLLKRLLKRDAKHMIERLQAAIAARSTNHGPGSITR